MTDYSRAGSPGDYGLVTPPAGGGTGPGGSNGARDHARQPGGDAPPGDPGATAPDEPPAGVDEPSPTGAAGPPGLDLAGIDLDSLDLDGLDPEDLEVLEEVLEEELAELDAAADGDGDGEQAGEDPPRPRVPVARRTMMTSLGTAGAGLIALVVAVAFAVSGIGPIDRPLLISPLGLDGPPASTAGAAAVPSRPGGKVPRVVGMAFARARAIIEGAGFRVQVRYQQGSQPRETVVAQSPAPGTGLGRRGVVTLVVSLGIVVGPVTGPLPPLPPVATSAPPTTRRPAPTTRPTNTTARPTTTDPPTTDPPTTEPPTTEPPTTETTIPVG
jgi:hypothetical protein